MFLQDGGPVELTNEDMSDDELANYIKTDEELDAITSPNDQVRCNPSP